MIIGEVLVVLCPRSHSSLTPSSPNPVPSSILSTPHHSLPPLPSPPHFFLPPDAFTDSWYSMKDFLPPVFYRYHRRIRPYTTPEQLTFTSPPLSTVRLRVIRCQEKPNCMGMFSCFLPQNMTFMRSRLLCLFHRGKCCTTIRSADIHLVV